MCKVIWSMLTMFLILSCQSAVEISVGPSIPNLDTTKLKVKKPAELQASQAPQVMVNETHTFNILMTNESDQDFNFKLSQLSNNFTIVKDCSLEIAPGTSCTIKIEFTPGAGLGDYNDSLKLTYEEDGIELTNSIDLAATAVEDPANLAPKDISYLKSDGVYVYNDQNGFLSSAITDNVPTYTNEVTNWSIVPDLNANTGLSFDTSTGVISGTPTSSSARTEYTITATNSYGATEMKINIRTAPGFIVNDPSWDTDVNTSDDICDNGSGVCTLKAAIDQTNNMPDVGARIILIPAMTINQTGGVTLDNHVEIIGTGQSQSLIDGGGSANYNMYGVAVGASVKMANLTLQNLVGNSKAFNINGDKTLTLNHVTIDTVQNNVGNATIYLGNTASFYAYDSTFRNLNNGSSNVIWSRDATLIQIERSLIENSIGSQAAFVLENTTYKFIDTHFKDNNKAINTNTNSIGYFNRCLFTGHSLGIQINTGTVDVHNSTFTGNTGPMIYSTNLNSQTNIYSSTFTGNTVSHNTLGTIRNDNGTISLINTILSDNYSNANHNSCSGTITSNGFNLSDTVSADCGLIDMTDLADTDPSLSALADNGGYTHTMALSEGSLAIEAGPALSGGNCSGVLSTEGLTDQRGNERSDATGKTNCDIGAFETNY